MCRAIADHGGRRCPCSDASYRRAHYATQTTASKLRTRAARDLVTTVVDDALVAGGAPAELPPMQQGSVIITDLERVAAIVKGGASGRIAKRERLVDGSWVEVPGGSSGDRRIRRVRGGELQWDDEQSTVLGELSVDEDSALLVSARGDERTTILLLPDSIARDTPIGGLRARDAKKIDGLRGEVVTAVQELIETAKVGGSSASEILDRLSEAREKVVSAGRILDGTQADLREVSAEAWRADRDRIDPATLEVIRRGVRVHHSAVDRLVRAAAERARYLNELGRAAEASVVLRDTEEATAVRRGLAAELELLRARAERAAAAS